MNNFINLVIKKYKLVIAASIITTEGASYLATSLEFNNAIELYFSKEDPC